MNDKLTFLEWIKYRLWGHYIEDTFYSIKWLAQRMFRKNHLANRDIWNADYTLSCRILPVVKAFRDMKRNGYPMAFSDWDEEDPPWPGAKKEDFLGGGMEAWNKVLDEIVFAFEWAVYHDEMIEYTKDKEAKKWLLKYGDPFDTKDPKNCHHIDCLNHDLYHDDNLAKRLEERAKAGMELFHKYYFNLWD